jgi:hypothetical protein
MESDCLQLLSIFVDSWQLTVKYFVGYAAIHLNNGFRAALSSINYQLSTIFPRVPKIETKSLTLPSVCIIN